VGIKMAICQKSKLKTYLRTVSTKKKNGPTVENKESFSYNSRLSREYSEKMKNNQKHCVPARIGIRAEIF
jgi:hypothetical protein